ncbi:MAG TPA: DUF1003 domain-containing protein [Jatrophihabitans sp.]|jgi:uncharacterized membrane protein
MAERRTRLDQPRFDRRQFLPSIDAEAFGNWTERVARFLGTGRYLIAQSVVVVAWVLWNVLAPKDLQFDPWNPNRFIFLTLMLSLQASYSAPLILLAQNRQTDRDRINLDADRDEAKASKADLEYLARELASVRMALGEVATRDFIRGELSRLIEAEAKPKKPAKAPKHAPESA